MKCYFTICFLFFCLSLSWKKWKKVLSWSIREQGPLKRNQPIPGKEIIRIAADTVKLDIPTRLTLQVIEQGSQGREFLPTGTRWTVINLLLMHGRIEMLLETLHRLELSVAQVALVRAAVPGAVRCPLVPLNLLLHNYAVRVTAPDGAIDCLAV